jgi:hypothetical protein
MKLLAITQISETDQASGSKARKEATFPQRTLSKSIAATTTQPHEAEE